MSNEVKEYYQFAKIPLIVCGLGWLLNFYGLLLAIINLMNGKGFNYFAFGSLFFVIFIPLLIEHCYKRYNKIHGLHQPKEVK